uniref:CYRIA/CYRIB Rac1 binding domain-containing protein n=2 Tax=Anas platyrhynchos platyrhynchos TaxID=8840 RepID=A0A493TBB6_ANAPP
MGTGGLGPCSHPRPEARDLPSSRRVLWVLAARDHPQPSPAPPNPRGTGLWVLPRTPVFGASSAARGEPPAATTVGLGTASPSLPEPGSSVLPSLLPLHHPSAAPISIGGKRLPPGPGAPRGPRERLEPPVLAGRTGLSPPPPAAQHLFPEPHLTTMLFSSCFFSCRFHMGNLLKVLTYNELDQGPNFFLDFENAQPTEAETAVWNQVNAVLEEAQGVLAELQSYTGAGQEIREAIQNPGDLRLQERAWSAVCPLVAKLKRFYEFSLRLGEGSEPPFPPPAPPPASCAPPTTSNSGGPHPGGALPRASVSPAGAGVVTGGALSAENALRSLLEALTSPPYAPTQHLEREQALAKQFAEILHFTLSFDELKMTNPAIQNDFSYYRRTISRNRINNLQLDAESEVNNEMANRMSLFYAEATPMLKTLSNATTKFVSENKTLPIEDTTDCLSTMACVCRVMLETPEYRSRFTNTETLLFCMRVMVGVIILYDHVHPVGAFAKTSKIDVSGRGEPGGCRGHPAPPNAAVMPAGSLLMEAPQGHPWAARGEFVPPGGAGGTSPHCPSCSVPDEGVHQGPEGAALHQHRGAPERAEVSGGLGDTGTRLQGLRGERFGPPKVTVANPQVHHPAPQRRHHVQAGPGPAAVSAVPAAPSARHRVIYAHDHSARLYRGKGTE